ncbi:MAG TPA: DNA polymerase III subunit delta [Candidatus Methylomirabilis sp.]|jgi:DNA polymerase-3 subunit delta
MAEPRGRSSAGGGGGRREQGAPADARARLKHLVEEIRAGRPLPAYLCFGDEFLAEQAANDLIAALLPVAERGTNLERFSGDALDPGALLGSLRMRPLFGGRKVAAVFGAAFLASRESAKQILEAAREVWEGGDQERGARLFLRALAAAGVEQEDFADAGWPDRLAADPGKILPEVQGDLLQWVSRVRAHCLKEGLAVPQVSNVGDLLEAELGKGLPPDNILVLVAPAVDQRRRLFKALDAAGGVLQFAVDRKKETELPKDVLRRELQARAAAAGKQIPPDAAEAILQRAGASLRGFAEELDKLFTYVGDRPAVEAADVEAAFGDRAEAHVFDLTDALGERDVERALKVLRSLLGQGEEPIYLLNLLAGAVRGLIQAREILDGPLAERWQPGLDYGAFRARIWEPARVAAAGGDAAFFAMHPFRAYSLLRGASRFAMDDLMGAIQLLFETDLRMKSTGLDPARLLEVLLFDLCRPPEGAPT